MPAKAQWEDHVYTRHLERSYSIIIHEAKIIKIKYSILSTGAVAVAVIHFKTDMPVNRFFCIFLLNTARYHTC